MNTEVSIESRLLGSEGFGPKKFRCSEGGPVLEQMEVWCQSYHDDREQDIPLDPEKCWQIVNVARHYRENSFAISGNGNGSAENWERVRALAKEISSREGEAHFRLSENDPGFQEARRATMIALKSGHVLDEVKQLAIKNGSPELKHWLDQLTPSVQEELEIVILGAANTFWSNFVEKGWSLLVEWKKRLDRRVNMEHDSETIRELTTNGTVRYDENYMVEHWHQAKPKESNDDQELSPEELITALYVLSADLYDESNGKPGRSSSRIEGIIKTIEAIDSVDIPLNDLEIAYKHTKNPRKTAASYMSDIAKLLNLSKSSVTVDAETVYRFRRRHATSSGT